VTKRVEGAARGRPVLPPEERKRKVLLSLSPETVLALDIFATSRGATRSGAVERLVHDVYQKAFPARRRLAPDVVLSDKWIAYYDDAKKVCVEVSRRDDRDHPTTFRDLPRGTIYAHGSSRGDAKLRLETQPSKR
jgi:hypothetical protein